MPGELNKRGYLDLQRRSGSILAERQFEIDLPEAIKLLAEDAKEGPLPDPKP